MLSPRSDASNHGRGFGRRRFLELAGTAGAAALLTTGLNLGVSKVPTLFAADAHAVEALVLTCMDFRLVNEVGFLLNEHSLVNKYDQVILAGATLGVATSPSRMSALAIRSTPCRETARWCCSS